MQSQSCTPAQFDLPFSLQNLEPFRGSTLAFQNADYSNAGGVLGCCEMGSVVIFLDLCQPESTLNLALWVFKDMKDRFQLISHISPMTGHSVASVKARYEPSRWYL